MRYLVKTIFLLSFLGSCSLNMDEHTAMVTEHRKSIDELFADEKVSPLTSVDRVKFDHLEYFHIDKKYALKARIQKYDSLQYIEIKHTLNRTYQFIKWGQANFKLFNDSCRLTIYLSAEKDAKSMMLFIPFKDLTNGKETYGGGRYLDLEMPKDSLATLDFNLAYNPNCAYSDNWSCPLVPLENTLSLAIYSGVKSFAKEH